MGLCMGAWWWWCGDDTPPDEYGTGIHTAVVIFKIKQCVCLFTVPDKRLKDGHRGLGLPPPPSKVPKMAAPWCSGIANSGSNGPAPTITLGPTGFKKGCSWLLRDVGFKDLLPTFRSAGRLGHKEGSDGTPSLWVLFLLSSNLRKKQGHCNGGENCTTGPLGSAKKLRDS